MAKKEMNPVEKQMAIAFMTQRVFIFTHIGALMVLITSFHPYFWPHQLSGAAVLALSIVYDLWRSANKNQRRMLLYSMLLFNLWILVNYFGKFFTPPILSQEEAYRAGIAMTFGMLGHFIIVAGLTAGLMSLKLMNQDGKA